MVKIPHSKWEIPNEFMYALIATIIGALIGGHYTYKGTHDVNQEQLGMEKHNVALALYIDVNDISDHLNSSLKNYNAILNKSIEVNSNAPPLFYDPRSFYDNTGLYFPYSTDIYKLDSSLCEKLFTFYKIVMDIEYKRNYIVTHYSKTFDGSKLSEEELFYIYQYSTSMPSDMKTAIVSANEIKNELNEKYNLNITLYTHYNHNFTVSQSANNTTLLSS
jgi:hypothetical protein